MTFEFNEAPTGLILTIQKCSIMGTDIIPCGLPEKRLEVYGTEDERNGKIDDILRLLGTKNEGGEECGSKTD